MTNTGASVVQYPQSRGWTALAALLALVIILGLSACSDEPEASEVKPYPPPNPLFYELANSDGEVEGWMLGTIHALPEGFEWRTPAIDLAIDQADLLIVEVADLGSSQNIGQIFGELAETRGLPPIAQRVPFAQRPQLEQMFANSDLREESFSDIEDWASAIMLAQVDAPGDPRYGVDRAVIAEFYEGDVRGLETARSQLGIFDQLAAEDQRSLLEGTIEEWATSRDDPGKLLRAWIGGDVATLEEATSEGIMADPELRDALLVNRNQEWMGQIGPILQTQRKPLIAVGAAHLVGPDGLVTMLTSEGYTMRRLNAKNSQ